jgi:hypothetical protein
MGGVELLIQGESRIAWMANKLTSLLGTKRRDDDWRCRDHRELPSHMKATCRGSVIESSSSSKPTNARIVVAPSSPTSPPPNKAPLGKTASSYVIDVDDRQRRWSRRAESVYPRTHMSLLSSISSVVDQPSDQTRLAEFLTWRHHLRHHPPG